MAEPVQQSSESTAPTKIELKSMLRLAEWGDISNTTDCPATWDKIMKSDEDEKITKWIKVWGHFV